MANLEPSRIPTALVGATQGQGAGGVWLLHWHRKKWVQRELSGGEPLTTNNRMELLAAIHALEALKRPTQITLYTDSTYVRNGITQWVDHWRSRGWRTANKKPVKNLDLWQRLDQANQSHQVNWQWLRGHSGHPGNEYADHLACSAVVVPPDHQSGESLPRQTGD